jgi:ribokinase
LLFFVFACLLMPILVIGSYNTDLVIRCPRLPAPGETILGGTFAQHHGGKGANQAVAAARLAAAGQVHFVAKVGDDAFGRQALAQLRAEGLDITGVRVAPGQPSGVALINVATATGENSISVAAGANEHLRPADVEAALADAAPGMVVVLQLETPLPTVLHTARQAAARGLRVVLNPAPAQPLPAGLGADLYVLTPNETEAETLTGVRVTNEATATLAAERLHAAGIGRVVLTLGAQGAYWSDGTGAALVAPPTVQVVDTTAAGDCFNGALAVALSEGHALPDAVAFACRAAALAVTRPGAQASLPTRAELAD